MNAGSQNAEVEITVMILEFILGIKVVKLQMRNEAILRKLRISLHRLQQTQTTVDNWHQIPYNPTTLLNHKENDMQRHQ